MSEQCSKVSQMFWVEGVGSTASPLPRAMELLANAVLRTLGTIGVVSVLCCGVAQGCVSNLAAHCPSFRHDKLLTKYKGVWWLSLLCTLGICL